MKHFLLIICLIASSAQTCSAFQKVSEKNDCMYRNNWIFGKVLYNCYGEDSIRSWCMRGNRFSMRLKTDENGDIVDVTHLIRGEGNVRKPAEEIISIDSIKKYIIENKISFELCIRDSPDQIILDEFLNKKEFWVYAYFPYDLFIIGDPQERAEMIMKSFKEPFYLFFRFNSKYDKKQAELLPEEYNKYLLMSSLLNFFGERRMFKSCLEGLDMTVSLDLSPNHIPIAGNIQTGNIDLGDKDILLQRLLDIWQIFQIKFKPEPDQPASRLSISLKIKISDYPEFEEHLGKCKQISFIDPNP